MDRAAGNPVAGPTPGAVSGLAILGGTFDPPHATHVRLCRAALAQLPIGQVHVIVAGDHPHKRGRGVTPAPHRLAMCRLAFADQSRVQVDDRELHRAGPSYTVDTLEELRREFPERALYFLIGSDNLPLLPTWHRHHRLLELATVVTYPRAGHTVEHSKLRDLDLTERERRALLDHTLQVEPDDVASTSLRRRLRAGERELAELAPAVLEYIDAHGLYRA